MRRATVLTISAVLALPAVALAKGGVEFDSYPDSADLGQQIHFTIMAMQDPRGPTGQPKAIVGKHPLVTFRSKSGAVIRVRGTKTDLNGIAYGSVAFTDHGPWSTEMRAGDLYIPPEYSEPIRVGIGLTQTTPAADPSPKPAAAAPERTEFPWAWVLSLGAIGSALLVFTLRRRGRWGAA